jgi:hypothetical protein
MKRKYPRYGTTKRNVLVNTSMNIAAFNKRLQFIETLWHSFVDMEGPDGLCPRRQALQ